jgi:uroporphyrinogen decarboxylase
MAKIIEIGVRIEEIEARRKRVEAAKRFKEPDRVPVMPAFAYRFLIPMVGTKFQDYYADPETMLRTQILAQKWIMENVRTDAYTITGPWVGAWTDFQNSYEAGSLGCEVIFPENDIPWNGPGWVKTEKDLRRLEEIDFIHTGLNARQIEYRRAMVNLAEKYPVRFKGGPVFYPGAQACFTRTTDGPFAVAGDVMGQTELFLAVAENPDFVREVLRIITDKLIDYFDFCWEEEKLPPPRDFAWSDDLAMSLSAETFKKLVMPFDQKLRLHFDGWLSFHMCGKTDHLLKIFRDDLKINEFQGFGYQVDLEHIASVMGGKVVLIGNVNPMLIHSGTPAQVREATRRVIEVLAPRKGLIIQDGNNIPPGSPLENINAMMDAAEIYGRYRR